MTPDSSGVPDHRGSWLDVRVVAETDVNTPEVEPVVDELVFFHRFSGVDTVALSEVAIVREVHRKADWIIRTDGRAYLAAGDHDPVTGRMEMASGATPESFVSQHGLCHVLDHGRDLSAGFGLADLPGFLEPRFEIPAEDRAAEAFAMLCSVPVEQPVGAVLLDAVCRLPAADPKIDAARELAFPGLKPDVGEANAQRGGPRRRRTFPLASAPATLGLLRTRASDDSRPPPWQSLCIPEASMLSRTLLIACCLVACPRITDTDTDTDTDTGDDPDSVARCVAALDGAVDSPAGWSPFVVAFDGEAIWAGGYGAASQYSVMRFSCDGTMLVGPISLDTAGETLAWMRIAAQSDRMLAVWETQDDAGESHSWLQMFTREGEPVTQAVAVSSSLPEPASGLPCVVGGDEGFSLAVYSEHNSERFMHAVDVDWQGTITDKDDRWTVAEKPEWVEVARAGDGDVHLTWSYNANAEFATMGDPRVQQLEPLSPFPQVGATRSGVWISTWEFTSSTQSAKAVRADGSAEVVLMEGGGPSAYFAVGEGGGAVAVGDGDVDPQSAVIRVDDDMRVLARLDWPKGVVLFGIAPIDAEHYLVLEAATDGSTPPRIVPVDFSK